MARRKSLALLEVWLNGHLSGTREKQIYRSSVDAAERALRVPMDVG